MTFEEGTCAAWLHDLLKPHVARVWVCDPRKNPLMKTGNKNDRADARKLAELLYLGKLNPVYDGETGIRTQGTDPQLRRAGPRFHSGDESSETSLQKLGNSLRGAARIRTCASPKFCPPVISTGYSVAVHR